MIFCNCLTKREKIENNGQSSNVSSKVSLLSSTESCAFITWMKITARMFVSEIECRHECLCCS